MDAKIGPDIPGVTDPDILFHYRLGVFHAVWATIDVTMDFAIGRFMGVGDEEALLITWGMMFGAKAKLLAKLIHRSKYPQMQELMTPLRAIQGHAKRDILAHGYQLQNDTVVAFLEKSRGSDFETKLHTFTREEFREHVRKLIGHIQDFAAALGDPEEEISAFVDTARSLASKSGTSPSRPTSNK